MPEPSASKLSKPHTLITRRDWIGLTSGAIAMTAMQAGSNVYGNHPLTHTRFASDESIPKKKVAAVVTVYRKNSHADVLVGKILEGWQQDGGPGPALELVSLYVDQFPEEDLSVKLSQKHGFRMCKTIREAITLGGNEVAVDGVLSIGEHGEYPWNEFGQHLYPRKRFFEEITDTFANCKRVVPVFNDKHPGPEWKDALWMYQRAKELQVPWMAGSSLPVSFRRPDANLKLNAKVEACVGIGYSGLDIYGIHTLEFLQCILERRAGAESGVRSVQSVPTSQIGRLLTEGIIDGNLMDQGLAVTNTDRAAVLQSPPADGAVFLIEYKDGLMVPVLMLPGLAQGIAVAVKPQGEASFATRVEEREKPYYPHFAYLLKGIEAMIHTGRPAYPVERNMLTAGTLDRLLVSLREGSRQIETPDLEIAYQPTDYSYAPHLTLEGLR